MDSVTIINRNKAGRREVEQALAAVGIASSVKLADGGQVASHVRKAIKDGARRIIVGGGDGTVNAAAGALAGSKVALGILPLGTLNHFARDLGIPFNLDLAAAAIASGKERRVDIAEVNGRAFVNNASIGLYPLMVVDRDAQRERLGRSKRMAMLVASIRTMTRFHARRLKLSSDGGEARVDTPLLFVGNNDYRLAMPGAGRRETLDGGRLCVMVMRSKSLPGFLAATGRALLGIGRQDDMVRLEGVRELKVDSARSQLTLAMDGETVTLASPLTFRVRPEALTVIAPSG